jgi:hypothetical protein
VVYLEDLAALITTKKMFHHPSHLIPLGHYFQESVKPQVVYLETVVIRVILILLKKKDKLQKNPNKARCSNTLIREQSKYQF